MTKLVQTICGGVMALAIGLAAGCGSEPKPGGTPAAGAPGTEAKAPEKPPQPHPFRGKVEKVDKDAKLVMVAGEDVEGWMGAMTMMYEIQPAEMLEKLTAGDQITATVYDQDFKTLHDVKAAPAAAK